jgi:hypothetical protein
MAAYIVAGAYFLFNGAMIISYYLGKRFIGMKSLYSVSMLLFVS